MSEYPHLFLTDDVIHIRGLSPVEVQRLSLAFLREGQWEAVVPGMDSLALRFDPAVRNSETLMIVIARQMAAMDTTGCVRSAESIEITLCSDDMFAPDKAAVCAAFSVPPDQFDPWLESLEMTVAMLGFQPGFAYLCTGGNLPAVPRLPTPRQRVEAGSVGFLGDQCGIYPFAGPGGWPIIGRTPLALFDPARESPALLQAGMRVRFRTISLKEYRDTKATQAQ